ncbi:MAG: carboxypeptidase-like regulatory domain-containing protein [Bacteroidetes bacterium]|nr:carboxypeptidase-like regulatory domain-containing protein [Bacteroidota bacterium]
MNKRWVLVIGLILLTGARMFLSGQEKEQNAINLKFDNQSFKKVIQAIELAYDCSFTYSSDLIEKQQSVSLSVSNLSLHDALEILLKDRNIKYSIKGKNVVLSENKIVKQYTISGLIIEKGSGESLIGATIYSPKQGKGTASNQFGFYSIRLDEGEYMLETSYIGYEVMHKKIKLNKDTKLDVALNPETTLLKEATVIARKVDANVTAIKMSRAKMEIKTINAMPAFMGETDVMKSLQMLPGVQSSGDATANLNVRGGSYDQNLILLDDAPIYNPSHALGFFSVFNADAIKNVEIYKGGMPAQYGDRLSSVVDIRMKDGNLNEYEGVANVGTIASKLSFEGPIQKGKASFIISGRYSYAGFTADNFSKLADGIGIFKEELGNYQEGNKVNFYDLNLKLNYILNDKNRFYLSAYTGRDNFYFKLIDEKSSMDWGNTTSTLRWNHIVNQRLFSNTTITFSNFDYSYYIKDDIRNFEWSSDLQEIDLKNDFDFYLNPQNHIKFGFAANYHYVNPGEIAPRSETSITEAVQLEKNKGIESSVYLSNKSKFTKNFSVEYGIRFSSLIRFGKGEVYQYATENKETIVGSKKYNSGDIRKTYAGLEPRLNFRYSVNTKSSIKGSYSRTRQYMHLLSTSSIGLPTDVWYMADEHIKPQIADHLALGYFRNFKENMYESSIELYYKDMQNQIDFIDNSDLFLNPYIEQEIKIGDGWAYGAEFLFRKKTGKLKGWFSYTWAKTERQIEGINNGNSYPTRYDKRNDLSIMLSYALNERLSISTNFTYSTGGAITAPSGSYSFQGITVNQYTDRNAYRLPNYHRLDLSITLKSKKKLPWDGEWIFSIYNIYNKHNAFSIYAKANDYDVSSSEAYMIYMFGIVPSISYKINF